MDSSLISMGTFNLEWTVRHPGNRSAAIPLLAKPDAILLRERIFHQCNNIV